MYFCERKLLNYTIYCRFFPHHGATVLAIHGDPFIESSWSKSVRHNKYGRTFLNETSAGGRNLYLTTHTITRQISIPTTGCEQEVSTNQRPQTHVLFRPASWIGWSSWCSRVYVGLCQVRYRRYIIDVFLTSKIKFSVFDSWFLYGTRDYIGVYIELARVHVIRQSVSWKRLRNVETAVFIMTVLNAYYHCATKMYSANESAFLILKNKYITYSIVWEPFQYFLFEATAH